MVVSLLPQPVALQPVRPVLFPQVFEYGKTDAVLLSAIAGARPGNMVAARHIRLITIRLHNFILSVIPFPPRLSGQQMPFDSGASGQSRTDDQLFTNYKESIAEDDLR